MRFHAFAWFVIFIMALATICNVYFNTNNFTPQFNISQNFFVNPFSDENNGFLKIPDEAQPEHGTVFIVISSDDTSDSKIHASKILSHLAKKHIPTKQVEDINLDFGSNTGDFLIRKITNVLNGEAPVVIVNGWIKAHPAAEDVAKQYYKTK